MSHLINLILLLTSKSIVFLFNFIVFGLLNVGPFIKLEILVLTVFVKVFIVWTSLIKVAPLNSDKSPDIGSTWIRFADVVVVLSYIYLNI